MLGRATVILELPPWTVILHFGTAMALLATLIVAAHAGLTPWPPPRERGGGERRAVFIAGTLAAATLLLGALTANLGAAAACGGFPLCNGEIVPSGGGLQHIHWTHRLLAYALTGYVVWWAARSRSRGALVVLGLVLLQVTVAAVMVLGGLPRGLQALHMAVGAAVWGAVVVVAVRPARAAAPAAVARCGHAAAPRSASAARPRSGHPRSSGLSSPLKGHHGRQQAVAERGASNDLLDRLARDPVFRKLGLSPDPGELDPGRYVGRAPEQVDEFLDHDVAEVLRAALAAAPAAAQATFTPVGLGAEAFTGAAHAAMQRDAAAGRIRKEYLAIVHGTPYPPAGVIREPLGRDPQDRRRVTVTADGAPSETRYEVLRTCEAGLSLVRCELITGRTHQIRVHLSARGWPVAGDRLYGGRTDRIARQALHAWRVSLPHPVTREPLALEAPLPQDFNRISC